MKKSDDELSVWEIQQIAIESAFHQADKMDRPIGVLLECYQNYQEHNPNADAIANDAEALKWLDDYWEYVCMVENGRQCSMKELDGFIGMADYITNPYIAGQVIEYLQYDDDKVDEETQNLIDRLKQIASRYNGVSKMKKSAVRKDSQDAEAMERFIMANEIYFRDLVRNNPFYMVEDYVDSQITWYNYELDMTPEEELDQDIIDIREVMGGLPIYNKDAGAIARAIWNKWKGKDASAKKSIPSIHDMIAQTRQNNNSLTKSRVDLTKENDKGSVKKMSWDDYRKLKRAMDDGTIDEIINSMNNVLPGTGNQFGVLFDKCMGQGSLQSFISNNYVPISLPDFGPYHQNVYQNVEGFDVVQFDSKTSELHMIIRYTIVNNKDVNLHISLWHTGGEEIDDEALSYSNVDVDWIDEVFDDANTIADSIYKCYMNMGRR